MSLFATTLSVLVEEVLAAPTDGSVLRLLQIHKTHQIPPPATLLYEATMRGVQIE